MRTSICCLLPLIVAVSRLTEVHPAHGMKRTLRTEETWNSRIGRASLLDFFLPIQEPEPDTDCVCVEPPTRNDFTIANFVCAEENERISGLFCKAIQASLKQLNLLNNTLSLEDYYALDVVPPSLSNETTTTSGDSGLFGVTPRPSGRRRFLQASNDDFTVFVPDNIAIREQGRQKANELYDANDPTVALYFKGVGKNIENNDELFDEFFFGPEGRLVREEFVETLIAQGELDFKDLNCGRELDMLSSQKNNDDMFFRQRTTTAHRAGWFQVPGRVQEYPGRRTKNHR